MIELERIAVNLVKLMGRSKKISESFKDVLNCLCFKGYLVLHKRVKAAITNFYVLFATFKVAITNSKW